MCVSPLLVINPKYRKIEDVPRSYLEALPDYKIVVPCGHCSQCNYVRARSWRIRLFEEAKCHDLTKRCYFVTLTIRPSDYEFVHGDPALAIRRFLELIRKYSGRSVKHFIVCEYGQDETKTMRLHFHGLFFSSPVGKSRFRRCWRYGFCKIERVRSIGCAIYMTKYITKSAAYEFEHSGKIFVSPALGARYVEEAQERQLSFDEVVTYHGANGRNYKMPLYYLKKFMTDEEYKEYALIKRSEYLSLLTPEKLLDQAKSLFLEFSLNPRFRRYMSDKLYLIAHPFFYAEYLKSCSPQESCLESKSFAPSEWFDDGRSRLSGFDDAGRSA
jgi:hypothetical protein